MNLAEFEDEAEVVPAEDDDDDPVEEAPAVEVVALREAEELAELQGKRKIFNRGNNRSDTSCYKKYYCRVVQFHEIFASIIINSLILHFCCNKKFMKLHNGGNIIFDDASPKIASI